MLMTSLRRLALDLPQRHVQSWFSPQPADFHLKSLDVLRAKLKELPELSISAAIDFSSAKHFRALGQSDILRSSLIRQKFAAQDGSVEWVDLQGHPGLAMNDTRNGMVTLFAELGIHSLMEGALDVTAMPQAIVLGDCSSLLIRCARNDELMGSTVQDVSNRLTIFIFPYRVVTLHRVPLPHLWNLMKKWGDADAAASAASPSPSSPFPSFSATAALTVPAMVNQIVIESLRTFEGPLTRSTRDFEAYEAKLFVPFKQQERLAVDIYQVKRRAQSFARTLAQTAEAYARVAEAMGLKEADAECQQVLHEISTFRSMSDELLHGADSLLHMLFQISSFQLNELIRVLTLFSAFFIPLSFVTSMYGMNLKLPLEESPHGVSIVLGSMMVVASFIAWWFRVKKFW